MVEGVSQDLALATALIRLAFPLLLWSALNSDGFNFSFGEVRLNGAWGIFVVLYAAICLVFGAGIFPYISVLRQFRKPPNRVVMEKNRTLDLWPELGKELIGDNNLAVLSRLPGNGVFRVDFTDLTLVLPNLPAAWDGLSLLVLSDLHFHGTPSRIFFDRIIDELVTGTSPDLVCLLGDYVDTDRHLEWIQPILGRLNAREAKLAILGNHDLRQKPERVRQELSAAGYLVLEITGTRLLFAACIAWRLATKVRGSNRDRTSHPHQPTYSDSV